MCPEPTFHRQRGAGLPVAIFVITVLALLVAGMAQLQESTGKAVSLQIQSQRAFYAAESGAQKVLADIVPADVNDLVSCPATQPVQVSFEASGLQSCSASVECEDDNSPVIKILSTGLCGTAPNETSRTVEVRVR